LKTLIDIQTDIMLGTVHFLGYVWCTKYFGKWICFCRLVWRDGMILLSWTCYAPFSRSLWRPFAKGSFKFSRRSFRQALEDIKKWGKGWQETQNEWLWEHRRDCTLSVHWPV
jgi:hypothetical protein